MNKLLQVIGIILLLIDILRIFSVFDTIITTDKQFLLIFFGGLTVTVYGFYLETIRLKPVNKHDTIRIKTMKGSLTTALICCLVMLGMVIFAHIN